MKRRLFSTLLVLALALTLLPTAAFAEDGAEGPPACTCETACMAEAMNPECSVCGAEDALPENCGKYVKPADNALTQPEWEPVVLNGEGQTNIIEVDQEYVKTNGFDSLKTGYTYQLTGHVIIENSYLRVSDGLSWDPAILDLNGYTLTIKDPPNADLPYYDGSSRNPGVGNLPKDTSPAGIIVFSNVDLASLQWQLTLTDSSDAGTGVLDVQGTKAVGIYVGRNCILNIEGGTITNSTVNETTPPTGTGVKTVLGTVNMNGGCIKNQATGINLNGGTFTMSGGTIENCTDGGVLATVGYTDHKGNKQVSTITMTGGTIRNCNATWGGGVFAGAGSTITMTGGSIAGCTAAATGYAKGGGVYVSQGSMFNMSGGRIENCKASSDSGDALGGGIRNEGTTNLSGTAEIRDCQAEKGRGGGISDGGVLNISDNVKITGCTDGGYGTGAMIVMENSAISGGTFDGTVTNYGTIAGGTFTGEVTNTSKIAGGMFYGELVNNGTISGYTVTYEYGELGGIYAEQIVQKGETAIRPTDPKVNGFTFLGWYTYDEYTDGAAYDFDNTPVTGDITLYAKWEGTSYGIRITDKDGEVYYVTSKNADDVLGDGTVVYVPGYWNKAEIPDECWTDDAHTTLTQEAWEKLLAGEELPGTRLPKLTLNGVEPQEITADANWVSNEMQYLCMMLRLELVGKNTISNSEERRAGIDFPHGLYLIVSGDGSLDVTADYAISTEGGLFYQHGGEVTLSARRMGIAHSYSHYLQFYGGKLTIQVTSTESNNDYGVLPFYNSDDTFQIMDGAAFRVGNSAEDNVLITLPSSDEFKPADIFDQWGEKVTTSKPYYLSLTANYTVTFDTDGGSAVDTQTIPYGEKAETPAVPARTGYTFAGWERDGKAYDFAAPVTEDLTLTARWTRSSSGGGSSGGSSSYPITIPDKAENGSVSVSPKSASKGTIVTVTVKPDSGYTLETITAADKNGNDLKLTDKGNGKYTFTMPGGKVEVKATFMEDNSVLNFFVDVPNDAYYFEPVKWAVDTGITGGTDALRFSPGQICTRAQVVTFLWRAAGKPVVNFAMNFSDVDSGAYYAEAVRWAASLGIVSGYGDGRFGVGDPITREQTAAMLYRFAKARGLDTTQGGMAVREFGDFGQVSPYAGEAMAWAVNAGILKGTGNRLLPKAPCTRAQIVTFLYRALSGQ